MAESDLYKKGEAIRRKLRGRRTSRATRPSTTATPS